MRARSFGTGSKVIDVYQQSPHFFNVSHLTRDWDAWGIVSLYLDRCQVDTPNNLVKAVWRHVHSVRPKIGKVVDFGAGDGRFAHYGRYDEYIGYEIDAERCRDEKLPSSAVLRFCCAFSDVIDDADVCIGNPPFVRNQDLPAGWRTQVSKILFERTGVTVSGLANAWQYFFLLALASLKADGLCALIIPYEWVARPSAQALRKYILTNGWNVRVYRLVDTTFSRVLTTSSITIVDKAVHDGNWTYFEESDSGSYTQLLSPSGASTGIIKYLRASKKEWDGPRAMRGLSPGTQKVLTLSEGQRAHFGLKIGRDVVPCITTLRHFPADEKELNKANFQDYYVASGKKCWLIRTDTKRSSTLKAYLDAIPPEAYKTSTCLRRKQWWKFRMPSIPSVLVAMSFRGNFPKVVKNSIEACAVGGVYGVYNMTNSQARRLTNSLDNKDIRDQLVSYSNGLRKIEINQLNTLLFEFFRAIDKGRDTSNGYFTP